MNEWCINKFRQTAIPLVNFIFIHVCRLNVKFKKAYMNLPNFHLIILRGSSIITHQLSVFSRCRTLVRIIVKAPKSCHITPILRWLGIAVTALITSTRLFYVYSSVNTEIGDRSRAYHSM